MRKILTSVVIILIATIATYSRPNVQMNFNKDGIYVKKLGKTIDGKWSTLAQTKFIERVKPKYLVQNAVYVKLKTKTEITQDKKQIKNYRLQSQLADLSVNQIEAPFEKYIGSNETDNNGISRIYKVQYSTPIDPYLVCQELMNNPDVEYATPIFIRYSYDYVPNDPRFNSGEQYALEMLNMRKAWEISKGSKSIKIAIVDSGIDWSHEDLNGNLWTNPGEIPDNGIDDDNDGYVDDVHGWDFVGNISANATTFLPDNDTRPSDPNNLHGTHVSGCADAVTDNNIGIASIGYGCSIIPIKVGADNNQISGILAGYEGILYAAKLGADVINCSWGGPGYSPAEEDIINTAVSKGSVVVVAAGNNSTLVDDDQEYPAGYGAVFCVGSVGTNYKASSFSDYGITVDIWAPGENILSTVPNNGYAKESGTSMASPIISGLVASLKSIHPTWTPKQLMLQIRGTADDKVATSPSLRPYYFGIANAQKAFQYNNQDPNLQIPGIALEQVLINSQGYISDFNNNQIKISFKNYLSPTTSDVSVKLTPLDNWVVLDDSVFSLNSMASNEIKDLQFNLQVTQNCPWFSGKTRLLATITSGTYINYELVNLPINIATQNQFAIRVQSANNPGYLSMNAIQMVDEQNGWMVGNDLIYNKGLYGKISGTNISISYQTTNPDYAIYAFDANTAFIGTGSSTTATSEILYTKDGGASWTSYNSTQITGFINFIHFYDSNNGIVLGDPINLVWGIATTTDGGKSWNRVNNVPAALTNEAGLVGSGQFSGDHIWFGTTMGRVFSSTDRGQTWSVSNINVGQPVIYLSFSNDSAGLAIFATDLRPTSGHFLAMTSDGAKNWNINQTINFTAQNLLPIYVFSPSGTNKQYILFDTGEVTYSDDNGNTWSFELSEKYENYVLATHSILPGKVRLWQLGYSLSYLDFIYQPAEINKQITLLDAEPIDCGNEPVNQNKTKFIKLKNTGNYLSSVLSYQVIPDEGTQASEFSIKSTLPESIDVGSTINFRVGFAPITTGSKSATIQLLTDGNPSNIQFKVIGVGDPANSVFETLGIDKFNISPNPTNGRVSLYFNSEINGTYQLELFNDLNQICYLHSFEMQEGNNEYNIEFPKLSDGVYFVILKNATHKYIKKIIINN
jgi:subtilisin family serine protease/photosystem II stability/assembly factor-like uncharacterized protein